MRPSSGQVCHSLMVVSYCVPGSAQIQAAHAIRSHSSRGLDGLPDLAARSTLELPVAVAFERSKKLIGNPDAVVRILPGDRLIGLPIPIRVIFMEDKMRETLLRIRKHSLDIRLGHQISTGRCQSLTQDRIGLLVEIQPESALTIDRMTSFQHSIEALRTIFDPVTIAATFCSSMTFQSINSSISGWSRSKQTILAARRVVPPDLIAPAARSPIFRNDIRPEDFPPPESPSPSPRSFEKLVPVPDHT